MLILKFIFCFFNRLISRRKGSNLLLAKKGIYDQNVESGLFSSIRCQTGMNPLLFSEKKAKMSDFYCKNAGFVLKIITLWSSFFTNQ